MHAPRLGIINFRGTKIGVAEAGSRRSFIVVGTANSYEYPSNPDLVYGKIPMVIN